MTNTEDIQYYDKAYSNYVSTDMHPQEFSGIEKWLLAISLIATPVTCIYFAYYSHPQYAADDYLPV